MTFSDFFTIFLAVMDSLWKSCDHNSSQTVEQIASWNVVGMFLRLPSCALLLLNICTNWTQNLLHILLLNCSTKWAEIFNVSFSESKPTECSCENFSACSYWALLYLFLYTPGYKRYSKLFTNHLYINDRFFKHIEPRLIIFIYLYLELNNNSKNI